MNHALVRDDRPLPLRLGGSLPSHEIAYETWGRLNAKRDNAVLVAAGISASSHVRAGELNAEPGYWDEMVGPGRAIDTDRFFVVSGAWLGGCFGTTGPSSPRPGSGTPYGPDFPMLTLHDLAASLLRLLDALGIERLHACVGSSLGAMVVLALAADAPGRSGRVLCISGTGWTRPGALAIRYLQRSCILLDPAFQGGRYPGGRGPKTGLAIARQLGFTTYRSPGEWNERFGRARPEGPHGYLADFDVDRYLDYQGTKFAEGYDANTYLVLSKAMDLFDLRGGDGTLRSGLAAVSEPVLVIGIDSDLLMPIEEQEEIAAAVAGRNGGTQFRRFSSLYGHDAFLKEFTLFTPPMRQFLHSS